MRVNNRNLIKSVLVALLLAVSCLLSVNALALETGEVAPQFELKSLDGEDVALADFKGRLVLLKLATTWCPTCKQLTAEIKKVGDFLAEKDVVVLEVFVQDSMTTVEKYLGDFNPPMTFHALLDDGQAYKAYNVYLIPRLLVIDADQVVRFDSSGRNVSAEDLRSMVMEYSRVSDSEASVPESLEK